MSSNGATGRSSPKLTKIGVALLSRVSSLVNDTLPTPTPRRATGIETTPLNNPPCLERLEVSAHRRVPDSLRTPIRTGTAGALPYASRYTTTAESRPNTAVERGLGSAAGSESSRSRARTVYTASGDDTDSEPRRGADM